MPFFGALKLQKLAVETAVAIVQQSTKNSNKSEIEVVHSIRIFSIEFINWMSLRLCITRETIQRRD